jgi:hypothetical protein
VREMEKTEQYQYVKITDALLKVYKGFIPYTIRYIITLAYLRIENKDVLTDGESEFWFDYKMNKQ